MPFIQEWDINCRWIDCSGQRGYHLFGSEVLNGVIISCSGVGYQLLRKSGSAVRRWDISYSETVDQLFGGGISAISIDWISSLVMGYQLFRKSASAVQKWGISYWEGVDHLLVGRIRKGFSCSQTRFISTYFFKDILFMGLFL